VITFMHGYILKRGGLSFFALFILVLAIVPASTSIYLMRTLSIILIYSILALSWDLIAGYYRISVLSFTHAALFCLGGYMSGLLAIHQSVNPFISSFIGGVTCMSIGLLLGLLCLRFPGRFNLYFLILSRGLASLIITTLINEWRITGGTAGLVIPNFIRLENVTLYWTFNYYLTLAVFASLVTLSIIIERKPLGYAIRAIYEDEVAAWCMGINVSMVKIIMLTLTGFYAGLAGAIYAHSLGIVGPDLGSMTYMLMIFFMAYVGGSGSIVGPILGAFIWYGGYELLRMLGFSGVYQRLALTSILLILIRFVGWKGIWCGLLSPILKKEKLLLKFTRGKN